MSVDNLTDNLISPTWWVSVVVGGIVVNLASSYLKTKIEAAWARSSQRRVRKRADQLELQRKEFQEKVAYLRDNPEERMFCALEEANYRQVALTMLILGCGLFGINAIFPFVSPEKNILDATLRILFYFMSALVLLGCVTTTKKAIALTDLLNEARPSKFKRYG